MTISWIFQDESFWKILYGPKEITPAIPQLATESNTFELPMLWFQL